MSKFMQTLLAGTGATLLLAGVALAAPKADTNQDGQITLEEFQAAADAKFRAADTDFNGLLDKSEKAAMREKRHDERASRRFKNMDLNGDGTVTETEMQEARDQHREKRREKTQDRRLEKFDTNNDGQIDDAEREAAKALRAENREKADKRKKRRRMKRRAANPDSNGDGLVSRTEHEAATLSLFTRMDRNGDGVLTKGEGRKKRRKGRRR